VKRWKTPDLDTFDSDDLTEREKHLGGSSPRRGGFPPVPDRRLVTLDELRKGLGYEASRDPEASG